MFGEMVTQDTSFLHTSNNIYILINFNILLDIQNMTQRIGCLVDNMDDVYDYACDIENIQTTKILSIQS